MWFASVTYAGKSKDLLRRECISSKMRRAMGKKGGCGYVLELNAEKAERAKEILRLNGINYRTDGCEEF